MGILNTWVLLYIPLGIYNSGIHLPGSNIWAYGNMYLGIWHTDVHGILIMGPSNMALLDMGIYRILKRISLAYR